MTSQNIYNKALLLLTVSILLTGFLATAGTVAPADAAARKTFNLTVTAVDKATNAPITATAKIVQGSFVKTGTTPLTASLKQASVSISIQDPTNYKFSSWSTGSTLQPLVFAVKSDTTITASFAQIVIPPPPPPEAVGSFYIPLYSIANHPAVANAKQAHPNIEFMVSINPSNGPGNNEDPRFDPAIQYMRNAGVEKIIGYVPTWYGRATENPPRGSPYTNIVYDIPTVKAYIDRYVSWYDVDGISFDEVSTSTDPTILDFYRQITDYAKSKGLAMLKENPGTPTPRVYIEMFDNTGIFESGSYPSESAIQSATFFNSYPREKFTIVVHSSPALNEVWLSMALSYVKYIYITNDGGSNPYDTLPTYMESELSILESG